MKWRARRHCPHSDVRGIYGDEIIHTPGWRRLQCRDCGRLLDGPVKIAALRSNEPILSTRPADPERTYCTCVDHVPPTGVPLPACPVHDPESAGRDFAQCETCQGGPVCYCTDTGFPTTPSSGGSE